MPQRDMRLINGNYQLGQQISASGLFSSYTALDRNTNDVVGLALIDIPQQQNIQHLLQPFEKRQKVQSTHVLKLHQWGNEGSRTYFVTDPPRGVTLQYIFDHENIELVRALDICRQVTQGLDALHEQHIAGIDLRPHFVTVDMTDGEDRVQIDDIGLGALLRSLQRGEPQDTNELSAIDPRYVAPEYLNNQAIGPWSDIYAVGILLFTLVTGRLPFVGSTIAETVNLQLSSPVPELHRYTHQATPLLQTLVNQAMAKEVGNRFASTSTLLEALESVLVQQRIAPSSQTLATQAITPIRDSNSRLNTASSGETLPQPTQPPVKTPWHIPLPTPLGIYAFLTLTQKGETGKKKVRLVITKKVCIIGRTDPKRGMQPDIDLTQFDPTMTVSRQHTRLRFEDTFFSLEDLKSRNKTRVNGRLLAPLMPERIRHGDTLSLGSVQILFEIPGVEEATETHHEQEEQDKTIS